MKDPARIITTTKIKRKKEKEETKLERKNFEITESFSSSKSAPNDVIKLKQNMSKMGYYKADTKIEPGKKFHEYPNDKLINAIKSFQADNGLAPDGRVDKGGLTEKAINDKYEFNGSKFKYPVNANTKQIAIFDGVALTIQQENKRVGYFGAMSGSPSYQGTENQNISGKGPLPEGIYVARQSEFQNRDDYSTIKRQTSWQGGSAAWGKSRVWLEPAKDNIMYGRSKFSIHGGVSYGSAGCIDLEKDMDSFSKWFKNNGKDLIIKVRY